MATSNEYWLKRASRGANSAHIDVMNMDKTPMTREDRARLVEARVHLEIAIMNLKELEATVLPVQAEEWDNDWIGRNIE